MWEVEYEYIEPWLDAQDDETVASVFAALELLCEHGPALGRPLVDSLEAQTMRNLKELSPASPGTSEVRILFAFDSKRKAIMLLAGDKSAGKNNKAKWAGWYRRAIPEAERLLQQHLERLG